MRGLPDRVNVPNDSPSHWRGVGGAAAHVMKKARTRAGIRGETFRVFRQEGYEVTSADQFDEAAPVLPATPEWSWRCGPTG